MYPLDVIFGDSNLIKRFQNSLNTSVLFVIPEGQKSNHLSKEIREAEKVLT